MICPSLSELPPPPAGKTGWPWTQETPREADEHLRAPSTAPRISIVTPSYNQGPFIEETIRSILLQGYPDLEYMIIDGGSTDGTPEIVSKYAQWISYSVSEPDRGQAHALNKGISRITGQVFGWINSDDFLAPGALNLTGRKHAEFPDRILAGDVVIFQDDSGAEEICLQEGIEFRNFVEFWRPRNWAQPGIFFPVDLLKRITPLDETLHYLFDHDLLCRTLPLSNVELLHSTVASYRHHPASKTIAKEDFFHLETVRVTKRYWSKLPDMDRSEAKRHCVSLLVRTGLNRAISGGSSSIFLADAIRVHPFWSVYSALGWFARRIFGNHNIKKTDPLKAAVSSKVASIQQR
jgi:glycosyltransferase involved in cell wall biosynthesis